MSHLGAISIIVPISAICCNLAGSSNYAARGTKSPHRTDYLRRYSTSVTIRGPKPKSSVKDLTSQRRFTKRTATSYEKPATPSQHRTHHSISYPHRTTSLCEHISHFTPTPSPPPASRQRPHHNCHPHRNLFSPMPAV